MTMSSPWRKLRCSKSQVRLDLILPAGQSFRWRETAPGEWTSVLKGCIWTLRQDNTGISYRVLEKTNLKNPKSLSETKGSGIDASSMDETDHEDILRDYFQLNVDLDTLFKQWSKTDPHFAKTSRPFRGVRLLRQDPVETLFGFICSSNNNIPRISAMVDKLCYHYGEFIGETSGIAYHSFPLIKALAKSGVEDHLRSLGFGYRAKFISQTARYVLEYQDENWLENLRSVSYSEAHAALCELPGVGAKVADCICLMSLDKHDAVPIDTHVWQITSKYYMPDLGKVKSLTSKVYKRIGDFYRQLFGDYAGWAHSVLFTADLRRFQNVKNVEPAGKRSVSAQRSLQDGVQLDDENNSSRKKKKME